MKDAVPVMDLDQAIRIRRSVRGFLPREIPEPVLREVFDLAQWAPSNCNVQPWIPHLVSGASSHALGQKMVAAALAGQAPDPDFRTDRGFHGIYRERQYDAARQLYGAMGVARDDRPGRDAAYRRNLEFFGAPHAVFLFMPRDFDIREAVDLGIYSQTLMLAMTTRGIGSCAQGALSLYPGIIRDHLGLDDNHRLLLGISFGYEDPSVPANAARVGRAPLSEALVEHK